MAANNSHAAGDGGLAMTSLHLPVFHASETHRFTPRRIACGLAVAALALGVLGCASDGLSARDQTGMDDPRYVMALSDLSSEADATGAAAAAPSSPRPQLAPPLRIAVAQFGEVAPPATLVDALRKDSTIFAAVEPIP